MELNQSYSTIEQLKVNKINEGVAGTTYLLSDTNEVYKEFFKPEVNPRYIDMLKSLTKLNSKSFAFPKTLIGTEVEVRGYIMDFVKGTSLTEIANNTSFDKFVEDVNRFERAVYDLTLQGIMIRDINYNNIFYSTESGIVAIDTDEYGLLPDDNIREMYRLNIDEFCGLIFSFLFDYELLKDLPSGIRKKHDDIILYGIMAPSLFLKEVRIILEGYYKQSITTLEDFLKITNPKRIEASYGTR